MAQRGMTRLGRKEMYFLIDYFNQHYVNSKLQDTDFAVKASQELGFPITAAIIHGIRSDFDIPANRDVARAEKKALNGGSRLDKLEARIKALEDRVEVYIKWCQGLR